jgi:hypothetical protein
MTDSPVLLGCAWAHIDDPLSPEEMKNDCPWVAASCSSVFSAPIVAAPVSASQIP